MKQKSLGHKIAGVVSSIVVIVLCVVLFLINKNGKTAKDIVNDVKQVVDDKNVGSEDENLEDTFLKEECVCVVASKKYKDWQEYGYSISPREEYDRENVNTESFVYGLAKAEGVYVDELGKAYLSYEDEYKKNAPEYAMEGNDPKSTIYYKDDVRKTGDNMCIPSNMCNITVDSIVIKDSADFISYDQNCLTHDVYEYVDKKTGNLLKVEMKEDYKGDKTGLGNLCYVEMELTVDCKCPWVTYYKVIPYVRWLEDKGEYYDIDNSVAPMEMYEPVIGYDGMPVYSETYCQGDGYPITAGEPYKFKYGYVVDKANLDNMYIEFDGFTGVLYKYLVKVTDGK